MKGFGRFYLDKEKDIIVDLDLNEGKLDYTLRTPNHHTGNLITNLAILCGLQTSFDENGLKVIRGTVPCYVDGYDQRLYIFRLGNTKVANIYPDGRIEMKASIPAISKTLMSQTKDYHLSIAKTIVKTYILADCKFETDLHTHMNGNLEPEVLIALGIHHQIRYPLYYIKKLQLRCTESQWAYLNEQRTPVSQHYQNSQLTGKYLERRIDDNTFINFADLILRNLPDADHNIDTIVNSLCIPKDGQAVFANLEKTYLYRYVFTKGQKSDYTIDISDNGSLKNRRVVGLLNRMLADRKHPVYADNTVFEDKLLWIARQYAAKGVRYAEITDTALTRQEDSIWFLEQAHRVLPAIKQETGVTLRFLAGIRRIPLTIIRDQVTPNDYLQTNLRVIKAIAADPYVAGADIIGEEINDITELKPVIAQLVKLTEEVPDFVIRIHAGENDGLCDNVANSLKCVREALKPGQSMPHVRIGHGLYTCNLRSVKGQRLLGELRENGVVLEFQITSNVRLNNLSALDRHPLKEYLHAGVACVQGTDGAALYGTDSIDEELALEKLLELNHDELLQMRVADLKLLNDGMSSFDRKNRLQQNILAGTSLSEWLRSRMSAEDRDIKLDISYQDDRRPALSSLSALIAPLPEQCLPVIIAGGSFNNDQHQTRMREENRRLIDTLLEQADPERVIFVIGHRLTAYEAYLVKKNRGRSRIHAIVPTLLSGSEISRLRKSGVTVSLSIDPSGMGLYKSFAYEVFKHHESVLLAFDGNSAAVNLIQEAKNGRKKCSIFVDRHSRSLCRKAQTLKGYIRFCDDVGGILAAIR